MNPIKDVKGISYIKGLPKFIKITDETNNPINNNDKPIICTE